MMVHQVHTCSITLSVCNLFVIAYRNAILLDKVKQNDAKARNKYNSQLKTSPSKLYDKPPSRRTGS